jgi:hypothetical protein
MGRWESVRRRKGEEKRRIDRTARERGRGKRRNGKRMERFPSSSQGISPLFFSFSHVHRDKNESLVSLFPPTDRD